ncbi:aldehyde dehydrogenase family protein, partial [Priestia megaterium]|uniref:aldehyde dehydrogenase family protein n=1 Tax=Priestia megaterium TaxID=1404 RepID=UPI0012B75A14
QDNPLQPHFVTYTTPHPIPLSPQILPFNFPIHIPPYKLPPALPIHNTLILNPSTTTSFSPIPFLQIIHEPNILPPGL